MPDNCLARDPRKRPQFSHVAELLSLSDDSMSGSLVDKMTRGEIGISQDNTETETETETLGYLEVGALNATNDDAPFALERVLPTSDGVSSDVEAIANNVYAEDETKI